jgi:hypothetical protein
MAPPGANERYPLTEASSSSLTMPARMNWEESSPGSAAMSRHAPDSPRSCDGPVERAERAP